MLDIKELRKDPEKIAKLLKTKDLDSDLNPLINCDTKVRALKTEIEALLAKRNAASKKIGELKKAKQDASSAIEAMGKVGDEIKSLQEDLRVEESTFQSLISRLPNLPYPTVTQGQSSDENVEIRKEGKKREFTFTPKNHLELSDALGLFDFKRSAKISGSGWSVYTGLGAQLEWALLNYMVDCQIEAGFEMRLVPHLVRPEVMYGIGQLPKFADQLFHVKDDDYDLYLIPTAEAALGGLYQDEILEMSELPKLLFSYSPCFRREAGAAGVSERGLIRTHQFNKVEMFAFSPPEKSAELFDKLVSVAESILEGLELHYRVLELVTGDLPFSAAKTYDLEVWLPGQHRYYECSSVSNCDDFQARRANIRFKRDQTSGPEFVHTLNGSGLATSRVMVALLETHQIENGSIRIPEVLRPYMRGLDTIPAEAL
jgi:seryl-tRNA synthetase